MYPIATDYARRLFERLPIQDPIHVAVSARVHRQALFGHWLARLFGIKRPQDREQFWRAF